MVLAKLKSRSLLFSRKADCTKYSYDSRSQLTGDGTASYGYDNAGNRNNSSQSITTGNRLDIDTNWDYSYDDEGNLTSKVSIAMPTVTWTYTWDVNNRLTAAVQSAGGNDLYEISYKYDVFGNRIEQIEDTDGDGSGASNVTTRFAWEGSMVLQDAWGNRSSPVGTENWNIWADLSSGNALQTRYVRGDEVDQLFARVKSNGDVAWYLTDRMGSVRQMLDATGSLENTITYDGSGNVIAETDAAFGDRWKWTGREYNDYTGLQYNRARYYSSESGRWVSEDPIGFGAGDYNLSRYVNNNSLNNKDASGMFCYGDKPPYESIKYPRKWPDIENSPPMYTGWGLLLLIKELKIEDLKQENEKKQKEIEDIIANPKSVQKDFDKIGPILDEMKKNDIERLAREKELEKLLEKPK